MSDFRDITTDRLNHILQCFPDKKIREAVEKRIRQADAMGWTEIRFLDYGQETFSPDEIDGVCPKSGERELLP